MLEERTYEERMAHNQVERGVRSTEVRVVNEKTGGAKGTKDIRWDLVPVEPMQEVARLYNKGMEKYAKDNWRKGYDWSLSYAAMMRHATQFWNGESLDDETKCHHLSSVVFHALALMEFEQTHPELDDRYVVVKSKEDNGSNS